MQKSSALMTWSGIIGAFGVGLVAVPLLVLQAYAQVVKDGPAPWFNHLILPMMLTGFILAAAGHAMSGYAGKGQDDIPTAPQVDAATLKAVAVNLEAQSTDPKKDPALEGQPPKL